jgi:hypothetical protein
MRRDDDAVVFGTVEFAALEVGAAALGRMGSGVTVRRMEGEGR